MSLLSLHHHQCFSKPQILLLQKTARRYQSHFQFIPSHKPRNPCSSLLIFNCRNVKGLANTEAAMSTHQEGYGKEGRNDDDDSKDRDFELEYLAPDGEVYQKTLRLVECAMFSAVSGLTYLLSNSLAIENYFSCFFALPIVFSAMRWGVSAARKTMVATFVLLFVLSGPVKALTYLLMHGLLGLAMGSMWRCKASWGLSIFFCATVRAMGAIGYVLVSSFLIEENILALITVNIHAGLTFILTNLGLQSVPSMNFVYGVFGTLLLINSSLFVFLLHLLYAIFFSKFGMKSSLRLPKWLANAI